MLLYFPELSLQTAPVPAPPAGSTDAPGNRASSLVSKSEVVLGDAFLVETSGRLLKRDDCSTWFSDFFGLISKFTDKGDNIIISTINIDSTAGLTLAILYLMKFRNLSTSDSIAYLGSRIPINEADLKYQLMLEEFDVYCKSSPFSS